MTRYFYRCPIAAAWQLKNFGIKFQGQHIEYLRLQVPPTEWVSIEDLTKVSSPIEGWEKMYVEMDSIPLLQPMAGDICAYQTFDEKGDVILRYSSYDEEAWEQVGLSIIMRNNLPFIAPEVEG